jgi:hypothetical protein
MAEFHKMKGYLYDNVLTEDPNDFFLRIKSEASLSVNDISLSATKRGGANISPAEMTHAVNQWLKELAYRASDGFAINTGWFTVQPTVKGVFNSPTEKFNPAKHSVAFDFKQGTLMRKELAGVQIDILGVATTGLSIAQVTDVRTGSVNDLLTPGRNLRITGTRLRIAGNDPANGVCFVCYETGERTKVDEKDIVTNNPSELMIIIPDLAEGTYRLELTTQFSAGSSKQLLKEPKTAVFDRILTVENR